MSDRIPVLLLGSYHMHNPRTNLFNPDVEDVKSPRRQEEIVGLVDSLAHFRPTRVALEIAVDQDEAINAEFQAVRAGTQALTANERHQIGFRLALQAGLERVDAVDDVKELVDYGPRDLGEILEWAKTHDPSRHQALAALGDTFLRAFTARQMVHTIPEILRWLNDPARIDAEHAWYLDLAELGNPVGSVGSPWVTGWYQRNLLIYLNLTRLAAPGARLFVVYGSGHLALLRHFLAMSSTFVLEDPLRYLPPMPPTP